MSLGLEWNYARGYFYITPDNVLHIEKTMPEDVKKRFIPEILQHQKEVKERIKNHIWLSSDMDFDSIVYDE